MSLKLNKFAATSAVASDNVARLQNPARKKEAQYTASVLAHVIAELCDAIVRGEVTHVTLGMPQSKNALLLTVNLPDKSQQRSGGVDLDSLTEQAAKDLLDTGGEVGG